MSRTTTSVTSCSVGSTYGLFALATWLLSARGRVPGRTPADEQDHAHGADAHQQTDHEHPQAGPDRPGQLDPGIRLDVDAPSSVGIHHDSGPATELGIPDQRLLPGALGLGDPEVLSRGWRPW